MSDRQIAAPDRREKYRASGRQIACVIRDPAALTALDALSEKHGGVTAAVTAALVSSIETPRAAPKSKGARSMSAPSPTPIDS